MANGFLGTYHWGNATAVKDGNVIHVVITDDSEESIQAANETLDQILARL